jgi:hypothetical protein
VHEHGWAGSLWTGDANYRLGITDGAFPDRFPAFIARQHTIGLH